LCNISHVWREAEAPAESAVYVDKFVIRIDGHWTSEYSSTAKFHEDSFGSQSQGSKFGLLRWLHACWATALHAIQSRVQNFWNSSFKNRIHETVKLFIS